MSRCKPLVNRNGRTQRLPQAITWRGSQPIQASTLLPTSAMSLSKCPILTQAQGEPIPRDSKRLLTRPAYHTPLRRPAHLSPPITRPATTANTTCRGPFRDRLSRCHKHLHLAIPASTTLSSGIHCLHTADRPLTLCSTTKILRDMRHRRSPMLRQRDPRCSLACPRLSIICQLMVATGRFLFH